MIKKIRIEEDFIKLDQLLKISDIVGSGGQAKLMILNGDVKVNGVTINQRGKKIRPGDIVIVEDIKIQVE
ncbi:RNA-binding S4 domain-containing protein [Alkaliphilus peptidifermentans]|uniref:Ribosome-associated protein n=1 Tax=Alkaliphilus peptidifermentans DSM 18978 TaxID=1120976 RepID=A0A1G5HGL1_9FIRM|nr:RNA-binding S4 domain-containing protein [Alkaliphilus peptidifermentans]SCY63002.1 ribosome-associated protein [Alkaliphilus peptidifermentans DSM 18978]